MALSEALEKEHRDKLDRIREEISSLEDDIHDTVNYIRENLLFTAIAELKGIECSIGIHISDLIKINNVRNELSI